MAKPLSIPDHSAFVMLLARIMRRCETYVELGIYKGDTFNQMALIVDRAVGVDINIRDCIRRGSGIELHQMKTRSFAKRWTEPIDLLFIDGNHRFEVAMADFDDFALFVRPYEGLVVLHDTLPMSLEYVTNKKMQHRQCWRVAEAIRSNPKYAEYEIVSFPIERVGLSVVRRAPTHMDWNWRDSMEPIEDVKARAKDMRANDAP